MFSSHEHGLFNGKPEWWSQYFLSWAGYFLSHLYASQLKSIELNIKIDQSIPENITKWTNSSVQLPESQAISMHDRWRILFHLTVARGKGQSLDYEGSLSIQGSFSTPVSVHRCALTDIAGAVWGWDEKTWYFKKLFLQGIWIYLHQLGAADTWMTFWVDVSYKPW